MENWNFAWVHFQVGGAFFANLTRLHPFIREKISIIYYLLSIIYYLTVQKGTVYPQRSNVQVKIYAVIMDRFHGRLKRRPYFRY